MSSPEDKNYAALRYSGSFGENGRCIGLKFNKAEIVKWFSELPEDERGNVRVTIAPRKTPSDANKFTFFEDKYKPKARELPASDKVPSSAPPEKDEPEQEIPF